MARQQAARKGSRSKDDTQKKADSDASENSSGGGNATYEEELAEYLQERIKPNLNRGSIPLLARSIAKDLAKRQRPDDEPEETMQDDEPRDKADEEYDDEPRDEEELDEEEPEAEEDKDFDDEADEEEPEAEEDEDFDDEADEEEPEAEDEEDDDDEADEEEPEGEADDAVSAFEEEMHQLQEDLGEDWIVRFSVQGDEAWLTAEKEDGSQHVEGPTADVLREAVELLEEGGGRSD